MELEIQNNVNNSLIFARCYQLFLNGASFSKSTLSKTLETKLMLEIFLLFCEIEWNRKNQFSLETVFKSVYVFEIPITFCMLLVLSLLQSNMVSMFYYFPPTHSIHVNYIVQLNQILFA